MLAPSDSEIVGASMYRSSKPSTVSRISPLIEEGTLGAFACGVGVETGNGVGNIVEGELGRTHLSRFYGKKDI
jgi:hypothetical protein